MWLGIIVTRRIADCGVAAAVAAAVVGAGLASGGGGNAYSQSRPRQLQAMGAGCGCAVVPHVVAVWRGGGCVQWLYGVVVCDGCRRCVMDVVV